MAALGQEALMASMYAAEVLGDCLDRQVAVTRKVEVA
jgi:hypothetical protein